ncbi:metal-dependent hydrolase [Microcoleus sp. LAD1_D5]|uniref:metal-dependent hydrolase n=1 Tax=Microcoleus sp. LAD1_D5 TaxID=2818813 RepID=UPI002FD68E42
MMAITHLAIAASITAFTLDSNPQTLLVAALGSQLPDLDSTDSYMGKLFYPIAHWIQERYPHRTITHCLYFTLGLAVISIALYYFKFLPWNPALALPLGHLTSCLADCFTKQGVQLFYPRRAWAICGKNPHARLATGSPAEYWVLAIFISFLILALNFNEGSFKNSVAQIMGDSNAVEQVLNSKGKDHLVYAEVSGTYAIDRTPADGRYLVVEQVGREFILQNDRGLFQTGKQILVTRITANADKRASVKISQLSFTDEAIAPKLYPLAGNLVFVSGEIAIDLGEDLAVNQNPGKFSSIERSGNIIKLQSAPLVDVYQLLYNSFGTGNLTIKSLEIKE